MAKYTVECPAPYVMVDPATWLPPTSSTVNLRCADGDGTSKFGVAMPVTDEEIVFTAMTIDEANTLLAPMLLLWATAWGAKKLFQLIVSAKYA